MRTHLFGAKNGMLSAKSDSLSMSGTPRNLSRFSPSPSSAPAVFITMSV